MKLFGSILLLGILTACGTTTVYKTLSVVGQDRKAGQVFMGSDYDASVIPIVDHEHALAEAVMLCKNWSYKGATSLAKYDVKCTKGTKDDCKHYEVIYTYQCLTAKDYESYQKGNLDLTDKKEPQK